MLCCVVFGVVVMVVDVIVVTVALMWCCVLCVLYVWHERFDVNDLGYCEWDCVVCGVVQ